MSTYTPNHKLNQNITVPQLQPRAFIKNDITDAGSYEPEKTPDDIYSYNDDASKPKLSQKTASATDMDLQRADQIEVGTRALEKDVVQRIQQKDEIYSLAYRNLKRKPLLVDLHNIMNDFISVLGTIDAARHYSLLKEKINQLWEYAGSDEYFTMVLSSIDSVIRFNKWRDFNKKQTQELMRVIDNLINKNITLNDVRRITVDLSNMKLNLFPFENYYEEKEKTKN